MTRRSTHTPRVAWVAQTSTTTENLADIVALSDLVAYAGGSNGKVLRTIDGGTTWQSQVVCAGMGNALGLTAFGPVGSEKVWISDDSSNTRIGTRSGAPTSYVAMANSYPSRQQADMYSASG
ncbi:MAG: hypothetical protein H7123_04320, partial [Thermoleophilia bacterium]|nr:hypothetical protein [Thermoleophilia bacterium]